MSNEPTHIQPPSVKFSDSVGGRILLNNATLSAITLIIILLALWMANTLYLSTAIARFERTHSINLTNAKANVHQFLNTEDESYKTEYHHSIKIALSYSKTFGSFLTLVDKPEAVEIVQRTFLETNQTISEVMVSRVALLGWHPIIKNLVNIAEDTARITDTYQQTAEKLFATKGISERKNIITEMNKLEKSLTTNEDRFSDGVGKLSEFIILVVAVGLWSLFVLFCGIAALISYKITQRIVQPIKDLVKFADDVACGSLSKQRFVIAHNDEISLLMQTFQRMTESLNHKLEVITKIADGAGDFTVEVALASERDVLGKAVSRMLRSLNDILSQVNQAIDGVRNGASQVSELSQTLSIGSTKQAESLDEITSAISEIKVLAKKNASDAEKTCEMAQTVSQKSDQGYKELEQLVSAISEVVYAHG